MSPALSATNSADKKDEPEKYSVVARDTLSAAAIELTHHPPLEPVDENQIAEVEIEREFYGRLLAARALPRSQRGGARRAAYEWRRMALEGLREKRERERQSRYALWKLQAPRPVPK